MQKTITMDNIHMSKPNAKVAQIIAEMEEQDARYQKKMQELKQNLENGTAGPIQKNGVWYIEVGTNLTPDEAFGPPSKAEIEAKKRKPLREYLSELQLG